MNGKCSSAFQLTLGQGIHHTAALQICAELVLLGVNRGRRHGSGKQHTNTSALVAKHAANQRAAFAESPFSVPFALFTMNRLFGRGKDKAPPPALTDVIANVCMCADSLGALLRISLSLQRTVFEDTLFLISFAHSQTDGRADSVQKKIDKLNAELNTYKQQMAKMPEGPSKVRFVCSPAYSTTAHSTPP